MRLSERCAWENEKQTRKDTGLVLAVPNITCEFLAGQQCNMCLEISIAVETTKTQRPGLRTARSTLLFHSELFVYLIVYISVVINEAHLWKNGIC